MSLPLFEKKILFRIILVMVIGMASALGITSYVVFNFKIIEESKNISRMVYAAIDIEQLFREIDKNVHLSSEVRGDLEKILRKLNIEDASLYTVDGKFLSSIYGGTPDLTPRILKRTLSGKVSVMRDKVKREFHIFTLLTSNTGKKMVLEIIKPSTKIRGRVLGEILLLILGFIVLTLTILGAILPLTHRAARVMAIQHADLVRNHADLEKTHEMLRKNFIGTIRVLVNAIDARDKYTAGHSRRVAIYSRSIAEKMGLNSDELRIIELGSLLHDIGKLGVSDEILNKKGKLTPEEYSVVMWHPVIGDEILSALNDIDGIRDIVRHHHERWDGKGYPDNLKDGEISLNARIVAVADAFDAMTSQRPYREAMSKEEAIRRLNEGAGTQFDPEIVKVFVGLVDEVYELAHKGAELVFTGW